MGSRMQELLRRVVEHDGSPVLSGVSPNDLFHLVKELASENERLRSEVSRLQGNIQECIDKYKVPCDFHLVD